MTEFDKYIVHGEPGQKEKADAWQTAIGLQDVDNISPTTEFVEKFLRNVILGEKNELRNRDMLVGSSLPPAIVQSAAENDSKSKFCTLNCTLEETAVLRCIEINPKITQKELASTIRKSERTVKTITSTLVEKGILTRRNGRRNGWWEIVHDDNQQPKTNNQQPTTNNQQPTTKNQSKPLVGSHSPQLKSAKVGEARLNSYQHPAQGSFLNF